AVVVSAPTPIQRSRVLGRRGMTAAKLDGILRQQLSDREKRRRADFVVPTGLGRRDSLRAVEGIIRRLRPRRNVETR
ncbi:MAG: dephospho-CoA kinase, partial [Alphaproteobacteria bacterium]|nr:dephospho-CoA kinase [Alphaproteobacteria bacterium]